MERCFPDEVRGELARRGHAVNTVGDIAGPCGVEIIRRTRDGMLLAGFDPRGDGWALACDGATARSSAVSASASAALTT